MGELAPQAAQAAQTEVYAPKTLTVWRGLLSWLVFFFQVLIQLLRGTPSLTRFLSFTSFRHRFLLSSSSSSSSSSSFDPLPVVELSDERDYSSSSPSPPLPLVQVQLSTTNDHDDGDDDHHRRFQKLTVVLDLDETLVSAYETSTLLPIIRKQARDAGLLSFDLECISLDKECDGKPKVNYVTVFERPGLQGFLKQISEFADLILFTAGLEGYARPLVDKIDIENLFSLRLYRPSTICTEYRDHVKDLSSLSRDLSRTVIVDNNPFSFLLQPLNGIPCIPFSAEQPHDDQLLEVLLPLLKHLSLQKDVRPVLYERFHMPEWFEKHGVSSSLWIYHNSSQET